MRTRSYGQTHSPINNENLARNRKDTAVTREVKGSRKGYKTMNLLRVIEKGMTCTACVTPCLLGDEVSEVCY